MGQFQARALRAFERSNGRSRQEFERTAHTCGRPLRDVRVDHRRTHVTVSQQLLDAADVDARLQQVRRKGMAQGMRGDVFVNAGSGGSATDCATHRLSVHVVSGSNAGSRIDGKVRSGEDPMPWPAFRRAGEFANERIGERDPVNLIRTIATPERARSCDLRSERSPRVFRKHHEPIALPLAFAYENDVPIEVDVLDAKTQALRQPQARAVEKRCDDPESRLNASEQPRHFLSRQHDWNPDRAAGSANVLKPRQIEAQNLPIQKQNRGKRLLVRGYGHLALECQMREESLDFGSSQLARMPQMMKPDESSNPEDVCLLSSQTIVQTAEPLDELVEQPNASRGRRPRSFHTDARTVYPYTPHVKRENGKIRAFMPELIPGVPATLVRLIGRGQVILRTTGYCSRYN